MFDKGSVRPPSNGFRARQHRSSLRPDVLHPRRQYRREAWTDYSLVQGTPSAVYIIQGHRGSLNGEESVQFGVGGGGGFAVSNATKEAGLKMAA